MIKSIINAMLTASVSQDKWTKCSLFSCVMNTGLAAGEFKYMCRMGMDYDKCGANKKYIAYECDTKTYRKAVLQA